LVFHFGNTNTGTGGAVRFPKTESKIGCSFLSRQYQKQTLSKNGKQVLLIFEYIPVFRFFPKMGQITRLDINVEWFLPEMEKREDERLSDKIV